MLMSQNRQKVQNNHPEVCNYPVETRLALFALRQLDTSRCTLGFSATFRTLIRPDMPAQGPSSTGTLCWHVSPPCLLGYGGLRVASRVPESNNTPY